MSKYGKSNNSNEAHPSNIELISVTNEVLKYVKSIDFNDWHPLSIELISVTNDVLKRYKSINSILSVFVSIRELKKLWVLVI